MCPQVQRQPLVGDLLHPAPCTLSTSTTSSDNDLCSCSRSRVSSVFSSRLLTPPARYRASEDDKEDKKLVAWIVTRSGAEVKRIFSVASDLSSLTDDRFASVCRGSLHRINSVCETASATGGGGTMSADLEVRLCCRL